ncbi:MAG: hypothetical protein HYR72_21760 [Deltaproteobacteria bacterium]|nr:hypothetical protein [Deltaproteobacteria bacterium]MBI3390145.1 hypothetical protein [Deltaproteobacteria bacterium]
MKSRLVVVLIVVTAGLIGGTPGRAESNDIDDLRQEVTALKQTLQVLDTRVEGLERQVSSRPESTAPAAAVLENAAPAARSATTPSIPRANAREGWHNITRGMSLQQVEALIGRPERTMNVSANTVWYYSYPDVGSGSVVFAADGSVIDWQHPPFNTWW